MRTLVVVDWDETLTTEDTTKLVCEAAYLEKPGFEPGFEHFYEVYRNAYLKYGEKFRYTHGEIDCMQKEIKFQQGLHNVEMTSVDEIRRSGLFQGVPKSRFRAQASGVTLREGVNEFFEKAKSLDAEVYILSVNWCSTLIKEVLEQSGIGDESNVTVFANDLEYTGNRATGQWDQSISIRTGVDKSTYVRSWRNEFSKIMYVGDSSTDLLPMLESDIAIAYEGGSILNKLKQLKLDTKYVKDSTFFDRGHIYVGNWKDIVRVLENHL